MANGNFERGRGDKRGYGARSYGGGGGGGRPRFDGPRFAPVKEGEELDAKIEAIAAKGDGIAKKDGFVIFVPNTRVGDEVKIRINKVLRRVAFAEVIGQGKKTEAATEEPAAEGSSEEEPAEETKDTTEESEEATEEEFDNSQDTEDF